MTTETFEQPLVRLPRACSHKTCIAPHAKVKVPVEGSWGREEQAEEEGQASAQREWCIFSGYIFWSTPCTYANIFTASNSRTLKLLMNF